MINNLKGITKGNRYGKLTIIGDYEEVVKNKGTFLCRCDCGKEIKVYRSKLQKKWIQSCGCDGYVHNGIVSTTLYKKYHSMKERCESPKHNSYKNYGEKGIYVSEAFSTFDKFKEWAEANGFEEGLSLERIDPNKHYHPNNCEWITLSENVARANKMHVRRKPKYTYIGISPEGNEYEFSNAADFARDNDMNSISITRVARGQRKTYKGWIFKYSDNLNI